MKKLFGTDGVRGEANVYPISPDLVLKLGQAIGLYFKSTHAHPRILIGKDTRLSGYMLEQALASGICSVGVDAQFLGPLPTPGIAYLTRGLRASAGIVISASHNPYSDNGIKIFSANGYKLPDEVEEKLELMLEDPSLSDNLPTGSGIGRAKRI
ncbi:MAG: phosphoglucosamine mutase, partial [Deltaproteobacteria bacterium]|nr:phosphoglucosamine mutase [Deltaproteobacteria bacterium]